MCIYEPTLQTRWCGGDVILLYPSHSFNFFLSSNCQSVLLPTYLAKYFHPHCVHLITPFHVSTGPIQRRWTGLNYNRVDEKICLLMRNRIIFFSWLVCWEELVEWWLGFWDWRRWFEYVTIPVQARRPELWLVSHLNSDLNGKYDVPTCTIQISFMRVHAKWFEVVPVSTFKKPSFRLCTVDRLHSVQSYLSEKKVFSLLGQAWAVSGLGRNLLSITNCSFSRTPVTDRRMYSGRITVFCEQRLSRLWGTLLYSLFLSGELST